MTRGICDRVQNCLVTKFTEPGLFRDWSRCYLCHERGIQRSKTENRRQKVPELLVPAFPGVGHFRGLLRTGHSSGPFSSRFVSSLLRVAPSPPLSGKHCAFAHDTFVIVFVCFIVVCISYGLKLQIEFSFCVFLTSCRSVATIVR